MANEQKGPQPSVAEFTKTLAQAGIALSNAVETIDTATGLSGTVIGVPDEGGVLNKKNDGCNINRGCTVNDSCTG
jgi:hypothetical protein